MEKNYLKMLVVAASLLAPQLIDHRTRSISPIENFNQSKIRPIEENQVFFVYELSKEEFEKQITTLTHGREERT